MPGRTAGDRERQGLQIRGRSWLTGKAYRYLNLPVPDDVQDDEAVVLLNAENTPRP